ncbi:MAG: DUF192 domain-containing protein [Nanoarchaeota archaeon]
MVDDRKHVISSNITICRSLWRKATGLMFRVPSSDFAYIFHFKRSRFLSVTMMFVFFPIDILFLDQNGIVIEMKRSLRPFSHYRTVEKCRSFIELPEGAIRRHDISMGSKVGWSTRSLYKYASFHR